MAPLLISLSFVGWRHILVCFVEFISFLKFGSHATISCIVLPRLLIMIYTSSHSYITIQITYTCSLSGEWRPPNHHIQPYKNEVPFTTGSKSIELTNKSHSF